MTFRSDPYPDRDSLFNDFARHVSPGKAKFFRMAGMDVVMGARSGATFSDAFDGRTFYNCHSNGGVFNLGHRNPRVTAALRDALDALDIGNHHLMSGHRARLAARLCRSSWSGIEGVVFGVSGGEAIDLAIKVVRAATKRPGIVSACGGYHGHTGLALAAGDPSYRDPFGPNLPGFSQVPFDDIPAIEEAVSDTTAAVILEPIPATLGMPIPSEGYLRAVQDICRARGAKLIIDEVQTGLGRTGTTWYYAQENIEPDVVVTGKGLSGGIYPITATLMTKELHAFFESNPFIHISTFGGAELGCAAALEVLDILEEPGFLQRVRDLSDRFAEAFAGMPFELRRRGLMMGLKFPDASGGMLATRMVYEAGIFAVWANNDTSVLQFLPPLTITDEDFSAIVARMKKVFG